MATPPSPTVSLQGVRVWLSGAVPTEAAEPQRASMIGFVKQFAAAVFQGGGHIIHGSHPSFTPVLLEEARTYVSKGGRRDCLTLAVSKLWSKDTKQVPI